MKKAIGALALFLLVVLGLSTPAHAATGEPTDECKAPVVEQLTNRPDTGTDGSVWAKDTLTRTMKVCKTDEAASEGLAWYRATVTDTGTFVTVEGKSPVASLPLVAGIEGTVKGGFRAHFTARADWADWEPDNLTNTTKTGDWVKTAFPSAEGQLVASYTWAYASTCETYKDNNGVYSGDITKVCPILVTPKPQFISSPASCTAPGDVNLTNEAEQAEAGVTYTKTPRTPEGQIVFTAEPKTGFAFPEGATTTWTFTTGDQRVCPSPSTSSPTPPSPSETATGGTGGTDGPTDPADPSTSTVGASAELPVTGPSFPTAALVAGGVLILSGIGLLVGVRMRRRSFEA